MLLITTEILINTIAMLVNCSLTKRLTNQINNPLPQGDAGGGQ